ncbi:UEV domain-containing protein [Mycena sp. CBHHK59/15]|nr:UEV domain-containing protein [Mycena sp. CBHHK59/15]
MDQSLTHKWLRQNLTSYAAPDRAFADIDAALARFPSLRPKSDVYTYDDGRTQLLLCLHGLLPIQFRNASYNIPVALWLTRDYPREPPLPYVVPTNDMLVKPGKHQDVSGRTNTDYQQQWGRKSEGCSVSALIDAMQVQFSKEPPVYAKPKAQPAQSAPRDPPLLPPKPQQSQPQPQQQQQQPQPQQQLHPHQPSHPHQPVQHTPVGEPQHTPPVLAARPPPPLPPHPLADSGPPHPTPRHPRLPPSASAAIPAPALFAPPALPTAAATAPPALPATAAAAAPSTLPAAPPAPPPPPGPLPDLLDEDAPGPTPTPAPAPPRPPNPELLRLHASVHAKLSAELASLGHALALDGERLRAHQADLLAGEPAIRDEMGRLEAVRDVCRTAAARTRTAVGAAERNVAELRRRGTPEVDELVCSTTIVHNQLINLVAEDNAIEDTIFHLSKALNSGRIDLERFLRTCRILAEEQFMKRALIEKIQTGIPMGMALAPAGY